MKYFNTTGRCREELHYILPPEPRLPKARRYVERGFYFVLHAPRQSGKTTVLETLARALNAEGRYAAVWFSCEQVRIARTVEAAEEQIVPECHPPRSWSDAGPGDRLRRALRVLAFRPSRPWPAARPGNRLYKALRAWATRSPRPLVLLIDEIDSLQDDVLISVLSQLRNGYQSGKWDSFPHSVVLCGMRDVRDYKAAWTSTSS